MKGRSFKLFTISISILTLILFLTGCVIETSKELADISRKVDEYVSALNELNSNPSINGTILIAKDRKILLNKSYGLADLDNKIPFEGSTRFRLASVSKLITATAVMQLVEKDKLKLDDTVSKYIPDFNRGNEITIQNLLTHTSGIIRDPNVGSNSYVPKDKLIESFKNSALEYEPGTEFRYSNCNYQTLAYIIEKVTNQSYEDYVKKNIFEPAAMTNTGCDIGTGEIEQLAVGYFMTGGKLVKAAPVNMSVTFGSGHIYSTVEDMYKLYNALNSGKLISSKGLDKMSQNNTGLAAKFGYGMFMGNIAEHRWVGHGGNLTSGYSTNFVMFPDDNAVIILLTNISSQDTNELINTLGAILFSKEYILPRKLEAIKLEHEVLQKYEGTYESREGKKVEVKLIGNQLCVMPESSGVTLIPCSNTEFYVEGHQSTRVKMKLNEKGVVDGMIVQENSTITEAKKID